MKAKAGPALNPKKLKKVEEIRIAINTHLEAINKAYKSGKGQDIDTANKNMFALLDSLKFSPNDEFYVQMRNHSWQRNHLKIIACMSKLLQEKNRMPTNTELAAESRLSEETIYKHLREFKNHDLFIHETDKFEFMVHRILATVFNFGVQGDIRACKVFLDYHKRGTGTTYIKDQNNYIQINGTVLSQETIKHLNPEQLNTIETILKTALPQPEVLEIDKVSSSI
ncbi:MAG: hypothetical protein KBF25_04955 [Chitinophagaceae bacterium]|nr:hypothetical protein [Chitinophagaceae bacterium]